MLAAEVCDIAELERERQLYHHHHSAASKTGYADFAWSIGIAFEIRNSVRRFHSGRTDRLGIDSQCNRKAAGCLSKHAGVELYRTERLRQPAAATEAVHVEEQSLLDLVTEFYENVYHYPLREHPEELALMTELVEEEQESE